MNTALQVTLSRFTAALGVLVAGLAAIHLVADTARAQESDRARQILQATGVRGGLVVHLGCGDGLLTAAMADTPAFLVHGLDADDANVTRARSRLRNEGLYGRVTIDNLLGPQLPYADNTVRLLVADALGPVPMEEVMRVLCPDGVALVGGTKTVAPRPADIDEWTHYLYDATNNAVSRDTVAGPPMHLQWVGEPAWARSHDHFSSVSAAVTSGGRLFSILDEGPAATVALPAEWRLVARDAFSGVVLWKRNVEPWEDHLRGFRSGPAAISRRLVALGERVYVTLGYDRPLTALDAATGKTIRTYPETDDTLEFILADGILYVVHGPLVSHGGAQTRHNNLLRADYVSPGGKGLMAIKADTGDILWRKKDAETSDLMPTALAVAGGRLYFHNPTQLVCLDALSGKPQWRADRPLAASRWAWTAPTLVVYGDVVLSADRDAGSKIGSKIGPQEPDTGQVIWAVHSLGGHSPPGKLIAFSTKTGERLWESDAKEAYNAPADILVADGLVWTGVLVQRDEPGIVRGLDPRTGEVKRTRPPDSEFFSVGMAHLRCYRNKATERFLVLGRAGIEWVDVKTGEAIADHWVRGACQYGVMPANGLLYAPSHPCACYIEAKLNGYIALAPARTNAPSTPAGPALVKGPAYAEISNLKSQISDTDWPTYRRDTARTGRMPATVPARLAKVWQADLASPLTSPVIAHGKVFLAETDTHTVHALDADCGKMVWSRTLGGRVDSPPTIWNGLALVGCRDGWVYCLRADDGELVWKLRAAPRDRRIVAYGSLESVWPVHGSILVQGGAAYFAAGRSSYIDGGIVLYRINPATGDVLARQILCDRDPETGREPQKNIDRMDMSGSLPDVLSGDGTYVYMRHKRFDSDLAEQTPDMPHLFSPAGFLDGAWWHRTYWMWGSRMQSGWGGWAAAGLSNPAGRIMVADESVVYAFGRLGQYSTAGTHVGLQPQQHPWGGTPDASPNYALFASSKRPDTVKNTKGRVLQIQTLWTRPLDLWVRGMVLTGETLFLAGPPDPFAGGKADSAALDGKRGGTLLAVSTKDGQHIDTLRLDAPPVWDGMATAGGRMFLSLMNGSIVCLAEKK